MTRMLPMMPLLAGCLCAQSTALIVLEKSASSLGFYTPEGKRLAGVPVGRHPHEMVLSADGRYAFTTDNGTMRIEHAGAGGNTVSIVDLAARKKIGEIPLGEFRRPHGVDLDHKTGRLAVTCELPDQLLVIDVNQRKVLKTFPTKGKSSHMVSWGPGARWAYVSNSGSATVAAIDTTTGETKLIPTGTRPEGSVLSADGARVYAVNREAAQITVIDTARNEAAGRIVTGKGPVRIARTPDGRQLVYALMHDKKIGFADAASGKVLGQAAVGGTPVSLTVSPDGKLAFASAEEDDTVYIVSIPDRKLLRQFKTPAGMGPDPVSQISSGR